MVDQLREEGCKDKSLCYATGIINVLKSHTQICVIVGSERNKTHKNRVFEKTVQKQGHQAFVCGDYFEKRKLQTLYIATKWVKISDNEGLIPLF